MGERGGERVIKSVNEMEKEGEGGKRERERENDFFQQIRERVGNIFMCLKPFTDEDTLQWPLFVPHTLFLNKLANLFCRGLNFYMALTTTDEMETQIRNQTTQKCKFSVEKQRPRTAFTTLHSLRPYK